MYVYARVCSSVINTLFSLMFLFNYNYNSLPQSYVNPWFVICNYNSVISAVAMQGVIHSTDYNSWNNAMSVRFYTIYISLLACIIDSIEFIISWATYFQYYRVASPKRKITMWDINNYFSKSLISMTGCCRS